MAIFESEKPLTITIINNEQTVYEGEIKSLSSTNKDGPFDILNSHSNFITIILEKVTVKDPQGQEKTFEFDRGVMQCYDNKIRIFLGI